MRAFPSLIVLFVALSSQAEDQSQDDAHLIQGKWKLVERHYDGNVTKGDHTLEFGADTVIYKLTNRENTLKYTLNPSATPKQMDWTGERDGRKRHTRHIYSLEGDTLKTCWTRPSGKYPTKFEANQGDGQVIHVYQRVKGE